MSPFSRITRNRLLARAEPAMYKSEISLFPVRSLRAPSPTVRQKAWQRLQSPDPAKRKSLRSNIHPGNHIKEDAEKLQRRAGKDKSVPDRVRKGNSFKNVENNTDRIGKTSGHQQRQTGRIKR